MCCGPWLFRVSECSLIHSASHCSSPIPSIPFFLPDVPSVVSVASVDVVGVTLSEPDGGEVGWEGCRALCPRRCPLLGAPFGRHSQCLHACPLSLLTSVHKPSTSTRKWPCTCCALLLSSWTSVCCGTIVLKLVSDNDIFFLLFNMLKMVNAAETNKQEKKIHDFWMCFLENSQRE